MGLIPEHIIGEIRERSDIVAVIGQHVKLRKAGPNHKGLCPFHQEKTPSFNVNADKGFFYCFGCQKKGDIFTFVMELEGRSFVEAAESLAGRAGVLIPDERTSSDVQRSQRSRRGEMLKVSALARDFYRDALARTEGRRARDYLSARGISAEIAERFALGFAPDEWGELGNHLRKNGASVAVATAAGLLIPRKSGSGTYDRFRDRVMCPVMNSAGDCVGFSGRRLVDDDEQNNDGKTGAKYINSPESDIYKKSRLLFGLSLARDGFRQRGRAILVEGNFDVINLHQAGFNETIAPLGTALTDQQATRIRRMVESVVLLFDGDSAGRKATLKSLQILLGANLEVRIATLPAGTDPDDLIRTNGREALAEILDRAQPGVEFFIDNAWVKAGASAHGRAGAMLEAAHVLRSVPDAAKRDLLVGQFALALGTDDATLRRHLRAALLSSRQSNRRSSSEGNPNGAGNSLKIKESITEPPKLELEVIAILDDHPKLVEKADELNVFSFLTDTRLQDMYSALREGRPMLSESTDMSPDIAKRILKGDYASIESPENTLKKLVSKLVSRPERDTLPDLQRQAELARRRGDMETARTLVRKILTIRKQVD